MQHFMIDGFRGYRSRFDDIKLIQEILEECPVQLGLQPVMPGFLLPYYNGVVPEDCGVSAFLFLRGGHMAIHTFSFRECYFADVLSVLPFDARNLEAQLQSALPCSSVIVRTADRKDRAFGDFAPIRRTTSARTCSWKSQTTEDRAPWTRCLSSWIRYRGASA